jgi:hypothetical protein
LTYHAAEHVSLRTGHAVILGRVVGDRNAGEESDEESCELHVELVVDDLTEIVGVVV